MKSDMNSANWHYKEARGVNVNIMLCGKSKIKHLVTGSSHFTNKHLHNVKINVARQP